MRTRGNHQPGTSTHHRGSRAGAVALAGLALLAVGTGPAHAADQPAPGKGTTTQPAPRAEKPKPVQDVTAPQRPTLGEASMGAAGAVEVDVLAESGSALVVREGSQVVASASATGEAQTLAWETQSGPHTFLVVATDAAGNVSDPAPLTLDVDATPPAAKAFGVEPGTDRDSRSQWSVTTERGTAYRLLVDGEVVHEGTVEGRTAGGYLSLADGDHRVAVELSDDAGNLRTLTETVRVTIPALWVAAKDVSETNSTERSFKVASAPGTRGFLRIPGGEGVKFELPEGRAEVTVEVEEGEYKAPIITVADTLDRKGQAELAPFEVDLTAPAVLVETVTGSGERGMLAAAITAGEGDTVSWRLVDNRDIPVMSGEFVADGTAQLLERPLAKGSYDLEVTATDANGNTSVETLSTAVQARPIINPDVMPTLTITLVLWILAGLAVYLRRRARRLRKLAGNGNGNGNGIARGRGRWTKRARLIAEHEQAVTEYQEQLAAFEAEDQVWAQRRADLDQLLAVAGGAEVEVPAEVAATVQLRSDERVLGVLPATLVELRDHDGVDVPVVAEGGRLVVTAERVAFAGREHREWELDALEQLRHVGQDRTLMKLAGQDTVSGVSYDDADLVRLYLELAMAEHQGDSRSVRTMLEQGVRSHELRRPQAPTPVGSAPVGGRRARRTKVRPVTAPVEAVVAAPVEETFEPAEVAVVEQDTAAVAPAPIVVAQQGEPADEQIGRELALR